jgi:hypothetical protein
MIEIQRLGNGTIRALRWATREALVEPPLTSTAVYQSVANLPDNLQVSLAALQLVTPPEEIVGVGQRVSHDLFWIYNCEELVSKETNMKDFKTNYNHNDYYYQRTDPRPDIPFEDNLGLNNPEGKWYFWAVMVVAAIVVLSYVFGFISVA